MPASPILLIRHAEKPDAARNIHGVDLNGREDPASLSVQGWQRSGALLRLFAAAPGATQLPAPRAIFAAASHARSARPLRTVQTLAQALGLAVDGRFGTDDVAGLVAAATACDGPGLVCWRHDALATIARALATDAPVPEWDEQRFDLVWRLTQEANAWRFEQVPQRLLPGDGS